MTKLAVVALQTIGVEKTRARRVDCQGVFGAIIESMINL